MMDFNRENSHECPCRRCPKKGCGSYHDVCAEFRKWRKKIDERNDAERIRHRNNDTMSEAKKKAVWRSKRYSRQLMYSKSQKAD